MTELMRLELRSGYAPTPGFVHLDLNPNAPHVEIVGPVYPLQDHRKSGRPPIPDASCCELRAVDVLEHLSYWDTDKALAEWARVLCPGGELYVQVPDADAIMREYVSRSDRGRSWSVADQRGVAPLRAATWRLLGGHADGERVKDGDDWRWNAHYSLWSQESLQDALYQAGLSVLTMTTNGHPNICCRAEKR